MKMLASLPILPPTPAPYDSVHRIQSSPPPNLRKFKFKTPLSFDIDKALSLIIIPYLLITTTQLFATTVLDAGAGAGACS